MKKIQKTRRIIGLFSLIIFPITIYYFSPYLVIQAGFEGVIVGSLVVFILLFLFSFFFGRMFCSFICPVGAINDVIVKYQKPMASKTANLIKFFIWFPWLMLIVFSFINAKGVQKFDFFYMTENGFSITDPYGNVLYLLIIGLFLGLSFLFGKRAGCHMICWMAPFMIVGRRLSRAIHLPSYNLIANKNNCSFCNKCNHNCPMSLNVSEMVKNENMFNDECILCSECVSGCPSKTLAIKFIKKNKDTK